MLPIERKQQILTWLQEEETLRVAEMLPLKDCWLSCVLILKLESVNLILFVICFVDFKQKSSKIHILTIGKNFSSDTLKISELFKKYVRYLTRMVIKNVAN